MANDIIIPSGLWEGDDECVITAWLASDGAQVTQGALIAEIMTAKIQYEITAPASGTLSISKQQDEVAAKGDVIGAVS
ncbi:lipoyl domain-containing protein [Phaeobacter inhibens]|uniref:lipoyl domain-containing protein n=1 Tax=Phaeobacter inhibens TaxID=221822 RepID=UPI0021A5A7ED|nr:lipoyl domain-containing protein [Phaeobacter inhibens]UWR98203.1 lipoyl domain-containing protein [Phaeobacter inhibens]